MRAPVSSGIAAVLIVAAETVDTFPGSGITHVQTDSAGLGRVGVLPRRGETASGFGPDSSGVWILGSTGRDVVVGATVPVVGLGAGLGGEGTPSRVVVTRGAPGRGFPPRDSLDCNERLKDSSPTRAITNP